MIFSSQSILFLDKIYNLVQIKYACSLFYIVVAAVQRKLNVTKSTANRWMDLRMHAHKMFHF